MFKNNKLTTLSLSLGLGTILTLGAGFDISAAAQNTNDGYQSNEKDATYGDAPAGLNPLDLMHRAQQLNRRNTQEFNEDSQTQLNDSVSNYKRLQQQRILEQQQQKRQATPAGETETIE